MLAELARGADQNLPGGPRLHIEGHAGVVGSMRRIRIAQFQQLMPDQPRVPVGNHQMALARAQRQLGQQLRQGHTAGHQHRPGERLPIVQTHRMLLQLHHAAAGEQARTGRACRAHQMPRDPRRIHHGFIGHAHAASQPGHQLWFQRVQLRGIDRFGMQAGRCQACDLGWHRRQFARIAGHPQRAAAAEFGFAKRGEALPQPQRIRRQRQLGRVVVHRHQMPHRRCGGAAADRSRLDDRHTKALARRRFRARGAHNAGADHDQVVTASRACGRRGGPGFGHRIQSRRRYRRRRCRGSPCHRSRHCCARRRDRRKHRRGPLGFHQATMPQANGSAGSITSCARAVMYARPLMRGAMPRPLSR